MTAPSSVNCGNSVQLKLAVSSACAGAAAVKASPATCAFHAAASESIAKLYVSATPFPVTSRNEALNPQGIHPRSAVRPTTESHASGPRVSVSHDVIA